MDTYVLVVDGMVTEPLALSYNTLLQRPAVTETLLLICPGFFADNARWTGVLVSTLLAEAGLRLGATQAVFHALDGYSETFDLLDLARDGVFLAYMVNGETLPKEHGYPIRLVVKGEYGSHWVKWVERIEIK